MAGLLTTAAATRCGNYRGERPGRIDNRCARPERDTPAAGIDEVSVGAVGRGKRPGTDHAILRLDEDVGLGAQIVDHGHRHAHAQIDEHAIANVLRGTPCDLQEVERLHGHVPTATTRST